MITYKDKLVESAKLAAEALAVFGNPEATGEEKTAAHAKMEAGQELKSEAEKMIKLSATAAELAEMVRNAPIVDGADKARPKGFATFGHYLKSIYGVQHKGQYDPRLTNWGGDKGEKDEGDHTGKDGWANSGGKERKDLLESIGASGGFLVPTEYRPELQMLEPDPSQVRQRATIIPMRRRSVQVPVLDQTGGAANTPAWYGGLLAKWTEEAAGKTETQPDFKQIELVAHKLVLYTEASDELLDDSAISLAALLGNLYRGAIDFFEENSFIVGTGVGQPLGVVNAGATITVARAAGGPTIGLTDLVNMFEQFIGTNGIWFLNRRAFSNLMLLNGPATNPSYVFMPSARDGMPSTLFGMPLFFSEHCPALGDPGDVILADWSKYLIGDRQAITIDSSKHYRFQYDITSWRAVHRVDGQPWLSAPITYTDAVTQTSPFVILGAKST